MEYNFVERDQEVNGTMWAMTKSGDVIDEVKSFKYLKFRGGCKTIECGCMKLRETLGVLCDVRIIPMTLKGKFYSSVVKLSMLYSSSVYT